MATDGEQAPSGEFQPLEGGRATPEQYERAIVGLEREFARILGIEPMQWVLVLADGEGAVHSLSSPGMPMWQRFGLLKWDAEGWVPQPAWTQCDHDHDYDHDDEDGGGENLAGPY